MSNLIDRKALIEDIEAAVRFSTRTAQSSEVKGAQKVIERINKAPTVDAVEVERYEELRESFVDYVCSGVPNPAPYCKNRCEGCVDQRGWCKTHDGACRGFNPDGERRARNDRQRKTD